MGTVAIRDVLDLPVGERVQLVQEIWDSILEAPEALPLTEDERRELDRRLESYRRDAKPETGSPTTRS